MDGPVLLELSVLLIMLPSRLSAGQRLLALLEVVSLQYISWRDERVFRLFFRLCFFAVLAPQPRCAIRGSVDTKKKELIGNAQECGPGVVPASRRGECA
jgi:hypothetical protein